MVLDSNPDHEFLSENPVVKTQRTPFTKLTQAQALQAVRFEKLTFLTASVTPTFFVPTGVGCTAWRAVMDTDNQQQRGPGEGDMTLPTTL